MYCSSITYICFQSYLLQGFDLQGLYGEAQKGSLWNFLQCELWSHFTLISKLHIHFQEVCQLSVPMTVFESDAGKCFIVKLIKNTSAAYL